MEQNRLPQEVKKFYFQWHITDKCNLRCNHCYQENYTDASDMTLEELKDIASRLFRILSKWKKKGDISITGGEPLARNDIFLFLKFLDLHSDVYNLDILSNGTLITDEIAMKLKKISKLKHVQISLDGASSEVHDSIRGFGNFNKAMEGIQILINHKIDVKIMFTLQRCNIKEVPSIIDLSIEKNISGLTIERLVPMGCSKDAKDSMLTKEEIKDVFQYISNRSDSEYDKGTRLRILKYRPLWINIDPCRAKTGVKTVQHKELGALCSIGFDGLCILPDATVLACRRLPIPIGNLKEDSLEKIWFKSELLWNIRDKSNLNGKCNKCELIPRCSGCRAMAYAYTGNYLEEDPQCWKDLSDNLEMECNKNLQDRRYLNA